MLSSRALAMQPSTNLVLWCGPVSASNLAGAALPAPARVLTISEGVGGIGSTAFANLGRRYEGDLGELLAARKVDLDSCATVTVAGFSAGHGLIEVLLRNSRSAARIDALVAADCYYTGAGRGAKPGYHAYCERAAARKALCVLSTSGIGGPSYPSAEQAVGVLLEDFPLRPVDPPPDVPAPASAVGAGGLLWLRYGDKYGLGRKAHVMHATEIAPAVLSTVVTPYLQQRASLEASPRSAELALAAAGLIVLASEAL